jgi:hypothetical protein
VIGVERDQLIAFLAEFVREHRYAVEASVSEDGFPQAAVVGVAVTPTLELVFDTLASTRKCRNLRRDPRIAFVIGTERDKTLQYQGIADEPQGQELERVKAIYLQRFPDGYERASWPGITYFRARPSWVRFSDFSGATPLVEERALAGHLERA